MVKGEKEKEYYVMLALEKFVLESYSSELVEHVNTILKCFYDYDILDEDAILACCGSEPASKIFNSGKTYSSNISLEFKKLTAPFVDWLNHAEEDEEESLREESINFLDIKIAEGTSVDDL